MKKILLLAAVAILMNGCCSLKRAERRVQRLAEQYPELVQMKAHPIDTFLGVPVFSDTASLRIPAHRGDTIVAETENGTFTAYLDAADTTQLQVVFESAPAELHYQDTIKYSQVVIEPEPSKSHSWKFPVGFVVGIFFALVSIWAAIKIDNKI